MAIFSSYFSILLSLSLSLFIAIILLSLINLFKNHNHHNHNHNNINIHSVLGFHGGIGLIVTAIRHVIVKKPPPIQPPSTAGKRDAGDNGKNDGWTCCTESLGSESSVKSSNMDDTGENNIIDEDSCLWRRTEGGERRRKMSNHEVKSFPPPLSSLNLKGQPNFFLRPVRKDGRLELTRVRIHRPEILHVWRHDGRLTAHLIPDEAVLDDREEQEQDQDQEIAELDGAIGGSEEEIAETRTEEEEEEEEAAEEEVGFGEWKLGLGLMRCHEVVNHHHHHRHVHHPLHTCRVGIA